MSHHADPVAPDECGVPLAVTVHFDDLDPFSMLHNTCYALLVERTCDGPGVTTDTHGTRTVVARDPSTMRPAEISDRARSAWRQIERPKLVPVTA
ncbi:hypothetical protein QR77_39720 [Streptomyces sp. 150FB]|uniref:hypothetical protein n=1 Tax=Streptomyces sp. 150FB TaxID=1576605 RepID=UPI000589699C|nr:hypothetical protein [Streptomyces sp. 150FB]KIF78265.1 hypothetical protein QR77_39720 [Streptomyces sp. 150FB]